MIKKKSTLMLIITPDMILVKSLKKELRNLSKFTGKDGRINGIVMQV